jgi:hypothetical protein
VTEVVPHELVDQSTGLNTPPLSLAHDQVVRIWLQLDHAPGAWP